MKGGVLLVRPTPAIGKAVQRRLGFLCAEFFAGPLLIDGQRTPIAAECSKVCVCVCVCEPPRITP